MLGEIGQGSCCWGNGDEWSDAPVSANCGGKDVYSQARLESGGGEGPLPGEGTRWPGLVSCACCCCAYADKSGDAARPTGDTK